VTTEKADPFLTTHQMSDREFITLKEGGFFGLIIDHPEVQLYRSSPTVFVVRIPGAGAVEISKRTEKHYA